MEVPQQQIQVFKELKEDPENCKCFECACPHPMWTSVTLSLHLCQECCGVHRGLGVHISRVLSNSLDKWNDKNLKLIAQGGNAKMTEFLEKYELKDEKDLSMRYATRAVDYYRRKIAALSQGQEWTEILPDYEEGRMLMDGRTLKEAKSPPQEEKTEGEEQKSSEGQKEFAEDHTPVQQSNSILPPAIAAGFGSFFSKVKASAASVKESENYKAAQEKLAVQTAKMSEAMAKVKVESGKEYERAKRGADEGWKLTKEGTAKAWNVTSEKTGEAWNVTKEKTAQTWAPVQQKLDEKGVTAAAKTGYATAAVGAAVAGGMINQKIESNEKLSDAKKKTLEATSKAAAATKSYANSAWGYMFGKKKETEEKKEEQNEDQQDLIEGLQFAASQGSSEPQDDPVDEQKPQTDDGHVETPQVPQDNTPEATDKTE